MWQRQYLHVDWMAVLPVDVLMHIAGWHLYTNMSAASARYHIAKASFVIKLHLLLLSLRLWRMSYVKMREYDKDSTWTLIEYYFLLTSFLGILRVIHLSLPSASILVRCAASASGNDVPNLNMLVHRVLHIDGIAQLSMPATEISISISIRPLKTRWIHQWIALCDRSGTGRLNLPLAAPVEPDWPIQGVEYM